MKYPHTYFDDEIREGFYESGIIKRCWAAQLEILEEIDKVCKKHDIKWFMDCGTLLGAVRHGGYIPWDDDLDICMLRDDYERFIAVAQEELPEGCVVLNCHNIWFDYMTRVVNSFEPNFDEAFLEKYSNMFFPMGIDIFPLDYISDNPIEEQKHKLLINAMMDITGIIDEAESLDEITLSGIYDKFDKISDVKLDRKGDIKHQIYEACERVFAYCKKEDASRVTLAAYWAEGNGHVYPLKCFEDTIMLPFENTELPAPIAYDEVLRIEYGDYMRIYKNGAVHDYPMIDKQEIPFMQQHPEYSFRYRYSEEDIKTIERVHGNRPGSQVMRLMDLMEKAHQSISNDIMLANVEVALKTMETCQDAAVKAGGLIENYYGEGYVTVGYLEKYCETVYQIYNFIVQEVSENENVDINELGTVVYNELYSSLQECIESVKRDILNKKEAVIIVYRSSTWSAVEGIWRKMQDDKDLNVYVIVPPYYERNALGAVTICHDESKELPDYVNVCPYDAYDFENRHPEYVITQNPYDECNYTTTVHPFFYARNLKKYTECLVYIPWFIMDEIEEENEKAWKTMQYFCTVPGVVLADKVIVQSEQMKDAYVKKLVDMAGQESLDYWENKISAMEHLQIQDNKYDKLSYKIKWNIDDKKVLLFNIGIASLVQDGDKAIDKIKRILKLFENCKNSVFVIWKGYHIIENTLKKLDDKLYNDYKELILQFGKRCSGVYDETTDIDSLVKMCDAYYGDASVLARRCEVAKLPVMLMNIAL